MVRWGVIEVGKGGRVMVYSLKRGRGLGKNIINLYIKSNIVMLLFDICLDLY